MSGFWAMNSSTASRSTLPLPVSASVFQTVHSSTTVFSPSAAALLFWELLHPVNMDSIIKPARIEQNTLFILVHS